MSECPYEAESVLAKALAANELADALELQTYYDFRKIIRSLMYQSAAKLIKQPIKPFWFSTTPTPTAFEILYDARLEWYKTISPLFVPGKQEDGSSVDVPCTIDYGEKYDMHSYHIVAFIRSTDNAIAEVLIRNADNYVVAFRVFFDKSERESTEWRIFKGEGLPESFGNTEDVNYNSGHAYLDNIQFCKHTLDEIFTLLVELQLNPKKKTTTEGKKLLIVLFVMLGEAQRFPILQQWFRVNSQSEKLQRLDREISDLFTVWSKLCKHGLQDYLSELEEDLVRKNAAAAVQEEAAEGASDGLEEDLVIDAAAAVQEDAAEGANDGLEEDLVIDAAAEGAKHAGAIQDVGRDDEGANDVGAELNEERHELTERNEDDINKKRDDEEKGPELSEELTETDEDEINKKLTEADFRRKHSLIDFERVVGKNITLLNTDITLVLDILMRKNGYAGQLYIASRKDEPDVFEGLDVEATAAAVNQNQGQGVKKNSESTGEGSRRSKHKGRRKGLGAAQPFQRLPHGGEADSNEENFEKIGVAAVNQNHEITGEGSRRPKHKGRRKVDRNGENSEEAGAAAVHHSQVQGVKKSTECTVEGSRRPKHKDRRKVDRNGEASEEAGAAAVHHNQGKGLKKNTECTVEGSRRPKYVGRRNRPGAAQRFEGFADGGEVHSNDDYELKSASFANFNVLAEEQSEESDPDDGYQQQGWGLVYFLKKTEGCSHCAVTGLQAILDSNF